MATTLLVAIIGSSGGGTATLGHTDPTGFLATVEDQLHLCEAQIAAALFVALDGGKGMDSAKEETDSAALYHVNRFTATKTTTTPENPFSCSIVKRGTLAQVNEYCRKEDKKIAQAIERGQLHGLICISCHVGVFQHTLEAAAKKKIPVTGSGGTSLSKAVSLYKIRLVGNAGGSVATTSFTRAVSYTHSLAVDWGRVYQPWRRWRDTIKGPTALSVLNACLPAFWGVCLAKQILQYLSFLDDLIPYDIQTSTQLAISILENYALPTACGVIMATSCSEDAPSQRQISMSSLIKASVIASIVCYQSILGGLLAGWLVSQLTDHILFWCIFHNVPATMTNMMSAGGVGVFVALLILPVVPVLRSLTQCFRFALLKSVTFSIPTWRAMSGFAWGCLSCYGSKVGWYHAFFLPAILLEMELGDASFLGAVDELTLVLVCAGICLGNLFAPKLMATNMSHNDVAICSRGLLVNLLCGDFIEVCYPFMECSFIVNVGGYLASGLSCAWLVLEARDCEEVPKSSAYMPLPASIALACPHWYRMLVACLIAVGVSFSFTFLHHTLSRLKLS